VTLAVQIRRQEGVAELAVRVMFGDQPLALRRHLVPLPVDAANVLVYDPLFDYCPNQQADDTRGPANTLAAIYNAMVERKTQ
jgi:hypothetical protein